MYCAANNLDRHVRFFFKDHIAAMEKASAGILSPRPVTFHYKTDARGTPQFGSLELGKTGTQMVLNNH